MIRVDRFLLEGNVHGQTNIADSSGVAELYAINSGCKDGLGVIEESVEFKTKIEYGSTGHASSMCIQIGLQGGFLQGGFPGQETGSMRS